jgi:hypothetical protein
MAGFSSGLPLRIDDESIIAAASYSPGHTARFAHGQADMTFGRRQVDSTGTGRYPRNKRRASRVKSGAGAWLRLDGGFAMRPCQLLDVSDTGVRIAVDPALRVPNDFVIVLSQGGQGRRAHVKWRNATQIGAQFI